MNNSDDMRRLIDSMNQEEEIIEPKAMVLVDETSDDDSEYDETSDDDREYDYEGRMTKDQINTIRHCLDELDPILKDTDNLPEWVQSKITLATNYIETVKDYMMNRNEEHSEEEENDLDQMYSEYKHLP